MPTLGQPTAGSDYAKGGSKDPDFERHLTEAEKAGIIAGITVGSVATFGITAVAVGAAVGATGSLNDINSTRSIINSINTADPGTNVNGVDTIKLLLIQQIKNPIIDQFKNDSRHLADESYHYCGCDNATLDSLRRYTDQDTGRKNGALDILERKIHELRTLTDNQQSVGGSLTNMTISSAKWKSASEGLESKYIEARKLLDVAISKLKAKKATLEKISVDAQSNRDFLIASNANGNVNGDNSLSLNTNFANYLDGRIASTGNATISNYKQLYDTIGLQNTIIENTVKEMDDHLLENNRKSNFESKNKDSMYIIYLRIMIGYFILIFCLCIKLIFFTKDMTVYNKIIIIILLGVLPFMMPRIEIYIYNMWRFIMSIMTGTVYHRIGET